MGYFTANVLNGSAKEFPLVAFGSVMRVAGAATRMSATENVTLLVRVIC
jgi:hypothetical protein